MNDLIILVPVYNDFDCLKTFCSHSVFTSLPVHFSVLVVDDGSSEYHFDASVYPFEIEILRLKANLGHQKALAVGLSYIYHHKKTARVIVMDVDGEDDPWHIKVMLQASSDSPGSVISAKRTRRKAKTHFLVGYQVYKFVFRLLTGRKISFGNFLLLPVNAIPKLVYKNEVWNHLAAAVIKSRVPRVELPLERNQRFNGQSKMSFNRLVLHGLGAVAVFIELVTTRLLIFSVMLLVLTSATILAVILIRSFTDLAIPGWASTVTGVMLVIFLQSFLLTLFTLLFYLSSQAQRQFIPGIDYRDFIVQLNPVENE